MTYAVTHDTSSQYSDDSRHMEKEAHGPITHKMYSAVVRERDAVVRDRDAVVRERDAVVRERDETLQHLEACQWANDPTRRRILEGLEKIFLKHALPLTDEEKKMTPKESFAFLGNRYADYLKRAVNACS